MLIKDIMIPVDKVITISPFAKVREVLDIMQKNKIKSLVINKTNDSDAYGIVTYKNILNAIVAEEGDIDLLNAYDIGSKPAFQASKNLNVKYVAKMMVNQGVKRILIIDNNELEGIITMNDIINSIMNNYLK